VARRLRFVVGTRGSRLALRQTEAVLDGLRDLQPHMTFELREIRTEGDRRAGESLARIGGQGVFVKEIEAALLRGEIDLAVHSLKDMPADLAAGLTIAALPERADARDALVTRGGIALGGLPPGARVGTGSARRAVQLRALRDDIDPVDIRGNVDTRVRKVDDGQVDGVLLAVAGLERLGLLERAAEVLPAEAMVPAVGQGALAVQAREDDEELIELCAALDHAATRAACTAERAFLRRLGGGCRLPFGAHAAVDDGALRLQGFISDMEGECVMRAELRAPVADPEAAGVRLAEQLLERGAAAFVEAQA
jgi:hydroxymethylbilane synthase